MDSSPPAKLKRALNLPLLTLYGLGTTIGAGIYALVGEIAGVAGYGAPLSFLVASLVAGFTACSFAELAARFPRAAGAALYVQQGFGRETLAVLVGLAGTSFCRAPAVRSVPGACCWG
jgi:amino acid transporter